MRWLTCILFFISISVFGQNPVIRRVCQNGNDNIIYWYNPSYPCNNFHFYIIWASFDNLNFFAVDSTYNPNDESKIQVNANSSGLPNKYYYLERRDSCGPIYNHISDTVIVDVENISYSYLDSVSVDINTNLVKLGWSKNHSPDFNLYFAYKFTGTYITLNPGGTKDTFQTDNSGTDPNVGSIEYDMNTTDSCGNPSTFGLNPHRTIYLTNNVDTCKKIVKLNWTPYVGWDSIRTYYIFENSGSGFILIDSTVNLEYVRSISLGITYEYFVRAKKDTSIIISSTSNKTFFNTNPRLDPSVININYITTNNPISQNLLLNFYSEPLVPNSKYLLETLDSSFIKINETKYTSLDFNTDINLGISGDKKYYFKIFSIDVCELSSKSSDTSGNILLIKNSLTNPRSLQWNQYFTWNSGIEYYNVYRGTGENNNYQFTYWLSTIDTTISDSSIFEEERSYGVCYYVEAKKSGDNIFSKSNIICFPGSLNVIIPSAFAPDGINNFFRPEGMAIDYQKSTMSIYDRWGSLIYHNYIKEGWNGKDQKGNFCISGIYLYKFNIISINNENQTKTGTVTLIR